MERKIVLLVAMMLFVLLCVCNAYAFTNRQRGGGRFGNPINLPTTPPFNPRPQWPKAYHF